MKKRVFLLLICCILCLRIFSGCGQIYMPEDGEWYCEELEMTICFGKYDQVDMNGEKVSVLLQHDGVLIGAQLSFDRNSNIFWITGLVPAEYRFEDFLTATCKYSEDDRLYVEEEYTGKQYVFLRQD